MQQLETKFQAFSFTPEEEKQTTNFTELQRCFLMTELATRAHQRLALECDPCNLHSFIQQEAYLKGQMELLDSLLFPVSPD